MAALAHTTYSRFSRWIKRITRENGVTHRWYETDYFGGL
jgi:hypothetical protein